MTNEAMKIEETRMREMSKMRRMLQNFYPFDDVQIWLIDEAHVITFARYIPICHIPVDDVVFVARWVKENK